MASPSDESVAPTWWTLAPSVSACAGTVYVTPRSAASAEAPASSMEANSPWTVAPARSWGSTSREAVSDTAVSPAEYVSGASPPGSPSARRSKSP